MDRAGIIIFVTPPDFLCDENFHNVSEVMKDGSWDEEVLYQLLPEDLATHILDNVAPPGEFNALDKSGWRLETRGTFLVKPAWEYLRRRKDHAITYKNMWVKGLHVEIMEEETASDDSIRRMGYSMPSKCCCCLNPDEESIPHVFFNSYAARKVWGYFFSNAGLTLQGLNLQQTIVKCRTMKVIPRLKPIFHALPSIITWELWKRRNSNKHGKAVSINRVVYQINTTILSLIKVRKPILQHVPHRWPDILVIVERYMPKLKISKVTWELPREGRIKINTDGASRGNPGRSSIGICLRNESGDIVYALGKEIE